MKIIYGLTIAACLVALSSQSTPFKKCADGPAPTEVRVDGCDKTPCKLQRGTNVTAEWDFNISAKTNELKPRVRAEVAGITVNYPFPQKNGCVSLKDSQCPLDVGQKVTYQLTMPILKLYPRVSLNIEFAFLDDDGKVVVCYKLPAKVV